MLPCALIWTGFGAIFFVFDHLLVGSGVGSAPYAATTRGFLLGSTCLVGAVDSGAIPLLAKVFSIENNAKSTQSVRMKTSQSLIFL